MGNSSGSNITNITTCFNYVCAVPSWLLETINSCLPSHSSRIRGMDFFIDSCGQRDHFQCSLHSTEWNARLLLLYQAHFMGASSSPTQQPAGMSMYDCVCSAPPPPPEQLRSRAASPFSRCHTPWRIRTSMVTILLFV